MSIFQGPWKDCFEAKIIMKQKWEGGRGLKSHSGRAVSKKPLCHCDNCRCDRFVPCTCMRKKQNA